MKKKASSSGTPVITKEEFGGYLQQAINLEIATIPVYLFTYYSIKRTQNQEDLTQAILNDLSKGTDPVKAKKVAEQLAIDLLVFSNQAGALIMSVAVEEMLHMSLSSNVHQALVGPPKLVKNVPAKYPTKLIGHLPEFKINLGKLSQKQLTTFLKIESPKPFDAKLFAGKPRKKPFPYHTIGEFYDALEACLASNFKAKGNYNTDRPQLAPRAGYYGPNNINTTYHDENYKPQFGGSELSESKKPNSKSSHAGNLVYVDSYDAAITAFEEIKEQGEGSPTTNQNYALDENGNVDPELYDRVINHSEQFRKDNTEDGELSHYARFLELYCESEQLGNRFQEAMKDKNFDFKKYFVFNIDSNPTIKDYKVKKGDKKKKNEGNEALYNMTVLGNAITSYLFLMTESCYYNDQPTQFELFMFGMHKAMIWLLDGICGTLVSHDKYTYIKDGTTYQGCVTFEPYDFTENKDILPKQQLVNLSAAAGNYGMEHIQNLPNVYLNHQVGPMNNMKVPAEEAH